MLQRPRAARQVSKRWCYVPSHSMVLPQLLRLLSCSFQSAAWALARCWCLVRGSLPLSAGGQVLVGVALQPRQLQTRLSWTASWLPPRMQVCAVQMAQSRLHVQCWFPARGNRLPSVSGRVLAAATLHAQPFEALPSWIAWSLPGRMTLFTVFTVFQPDIMAIVFCGRCSRPRPPPHPAAPTMLFCETHYIHV